MTTSPKCFRSPFARNKGLAAFFFFFVLTLGALAQDVLDGPKLARQLRSDDPAENSKVTGTIHLRAGDNHTNIPITCVVEIGDDSWRTIYETSFERLIVVHFTNAPSQYFDVRNGGPTNSIAADKTDIPFAGCDFSLADLGLEFLHWPAQEQRKGEMRLGQPCYVLDSSRPATSNSVITRVRSYVDKDNGGILEAEAYDAHGNVIKKFSLHGSSFHKVNGQWRLEKMEMVDKQKHSQTVIQFDIHE